MKYFIASLFWIVWCALHSVLIAAPVKTFFERRMGRAFRFYRLAYNLVAFLTVVPVYLYYRTVPSPLFWQWDGMLKIVPLFLWAGGIFLFIAGAGRYDIPEFMGVRQMRHNRLDASIASGGRLSMDGIHRLIRHPWYTGGIMVVWARDMTVLDLIVNVILTAYFVIGACLEERKLIRAFGEPYRLYRNETSMFLPVKWLKAVLRGRH
jgi:protein-S-isoprenylcysteine O-methyltransferase Ste14